MYLRFYGTRGSIPTPMVNTEFGAKLRAVLSKVAEKNADLSTEEARENFLNSLPFELTRTYGGNTSCVYLKIDDTHIILDMGSGIRQLGRDFMMAGNTVNDFHIFLSHLHWDHIQGLPFFVPAYIKGKNIRIY